jgi:hypothetical protein
MYFVGPSEAHQHIRGALKQWQGESPEHAVIEITDSGVYTERLHISLKSGQTLKLCAANQCRPLIRLLDWEPDAPDGLAITGKPGSWFILDGLMVMGRAVEIDGEMSGVILRHSTLVPGWGVHGHREASLELIDGPDCLSIEKSVLGAIRVTRNQVKRDPLAIHVRDSVLDALSTEHNAIAAPEGEDAYASLNIQRSTVLGRIHAQSIAMAGNSILTGVVTVSRRQEGCIRFCYVHPSSQTPRRYKCQPDLVVSTTATAAWRHTNPEELALLVSDEELRVKPEFNSVRYGSPGYCQLSGTCPTEISTGADDESEMGVFHDLFQPQRAANLERRLAEYSPAGIDVGITYVS